MPSQSKAQHRLMAAACTGNVEGVSKDVGCEFMHSDRGRVKDLPEKKGTKAKKKAKKRVKPLSMPKRNE